MGVQMRVHAQVRAGMYRHGYRHECMRKVIWLSTGYKLCIYVGEYTEGLFTSCDAYTGW